MTHPTDPSDPTNDIHITVPSGQHRDSRIGGTFGDSLITDPLGHVEHELQAIITASQDES